MANPITSSDLLDDVRDLLDEANVGVVTDDVILRALNRAQDDAADILAKQYPEPLLTFTNQSIVGGQRAYDMPDGVFEDNILKVEIIVSSSAAWELKRISYKDVSQYETSAVVSNPIYYYIVGKTFNLLPTPNGTHTLRFWWLKDVEPLVKPQGRVNSISISSNYVMVDDIGSDLTTASDDLKNYVNIVDSQTGSIKATMQVTTLNSTTNRITFKGTPTDRSAVYGKTVVGAIPTTVEADDYICLAKGNCVPFLKKPLKNYLIQHAAMNIKGTKLGEPTEFEERQFDTKEKNVKDTWAGRENTFRIKKRGRTWSTRFRKFFSN